MTALYTSVTDRALIPDYPYVYLKLFGVKQVFEYHNFLRFKSPWTLQIMLLPIQQPTARGRMKETPSHTILTLHNTVSVIRLYWMLKVCQIMTVGTSTRNNYITMAPEGDSTICKMRSR